MCFERKIIVDRKQKIRKNNNIKTSCNEIRKKGDPWPRPMSNEQNKQNEITTYLRKKERNKEESGRQIIVNERSHNLLF